MLNRIAASALLALICLLPADAALAQQVGSGVVSYTGGATQDFDTLAVSGTSGSLPVGWYFSETGTGANTTYAADNGSVISGNTYSYGTGTSTDRAFGTVQSNSVTATIGVQLRNDTAGTLNSIAVSFVGEQWRRGNSVAGDRLDAQFSVNATSLTDGAATWVHVDDLDFSSPVITGDLIPLDGNNPANRSAVSATLSGLTLAPNATLWLRWLDSNASGNDDGLAIDDVVFGTPVDLPPTVVSSVPAHNAIGVAFDAGLSVTFSEPVETLGTWFTFTCGASTPALTPSAGPATTFTLTPSAPIGYGKLCTLTVLASQVRDLDAAQDFLAFNETIQFETEADDAPLVVSTTPLDLATDVPRAADLEVTFSEPVNAPASAFGVFCPDNAVVSLPFVLSSADDTSFALDPASDLPAATNCRLYVDNLQITDRDGVPQNPDADTRVAFTTAALAPPAVISTVPARNSSTFPGDGDLQVVFDTSVTLASGAFTLDCDLSSGITLSHGMSGASFTIDTGTTLEPGDDCTLTIHALQVTSGDGLHPASDEVVDFTVAATGAGTYYDGVDASSCSTLRASLHALIDDHNVLPYSGATSVWTMIEAGEQDPNDSNRVLDIYFNKSFVEITDRDNGQSHPQGTRYNREHTWPQSYGFAAENGNLGFPNAPRTDGHHLFASEKDWNGARGNKPFADCPPPGCSSRHTLIHPVTGGAGSNAACNHAAGNCNWVQGPDGNGGSFEVWDRRKGDVARGVLYMDVRYEGGVAGPGSNTPGQSEPDLIVTDNRNLIQITSGSTAHMGLRSTLLAWHAEDPPDEMERQRNALIQSFQGNRNPFIDHPEWVECVFNCNCAPVDVSANDDSYAAIEDTPLVRTAANGVLINDTDAQSEPLTAHLATPPTHGTLSLALDGGFTYTPAADYCGADSFTYDARDPSGDEDTATVSIAVACVNDAPQISSATGLSIPEHSPAGTPAGSIIASDVDAGTTLVYSITAGNVGNAFSVQPTGQIVVQTPAALDFETMPQFTLTLTVSDGAAPTPGSDSADVSIVLTNVEEGSAIANDDDGGTLEDAVNAMFPVLLNDLADPDDGQLAVIAVGSAQHGSVGFDAQHVIYTPEPDYCGADSVVYTVTGGDTAVLAIDVQCINDPPVLAATLPDRSGQEGVAVVVFSVVDGFDDVDVGETLTYTAIGLPAGLTANFTDGQISGVPAAGTAANSPYTVVITAIDGEGQSVFQSFEYTIAPTTVLPPQIFTDGFED